MTWSVAKVLALVADTARVETFSAIFVVALSSSSAIDAGSATSDSSGRSSSSVMVTGYAGVVAQDGSHVVPSGYANCTRPAGVVGSPSIVTLRPSVPS